MVSGCVLTEQGKSQKEKVKSEGVGRARPVFLDDRLEAYPTDFFSHYEERAPSMAPSPAMVWRILVSAWTFWSS
jgi:hypothetical protein